MKYIFTLSLFFFALCGFSAHQITLILNMSEQTVSANGVHVAGAFQGWNPSTSEMTDIGGGLYSFSFESDDNVSHQFKFINGNDWPFQETVPSLCGINDGFGGYNRTHTTGNVDETVGPICFGQCADCSIVVEPNLVPVTFQVNMSNEVVSPLGVHLVGNIQGWNPASTEMEPIGNGIYSVTLDVPSNQTAEFRFLNGNDWPLTEFVPSECGQLNAFDEYNRLFEVGETAAQFGPVCFGGCTNCGVVVEPTTLNVTFQVDMTNEVVDPNGVHFAGNVQQWDPSTSPMTSIGNGIYEITFEVEENAIIEFRYINGNVWENSEVVPADCGIPNGFGQDNRQVQVISEDVTFGPVCFSGCSACEPIIEPETVMLLLQVNMSNEVVSPQGVHVAGNFQGWNPNSTVMTDLGGGVYEILYEVPANQIAEFRFINGSEFANSEIVPAECGVDNGFGEFNRTLAIGNENIVFGPVCFGECENCTPSVPTLVVFQVDMNNETVAPEGVFVSGSFNNWSATATQMADNGDGVYQAVAFIDSGSEISYKFVNGTSYESINGDCVQDDGSGNFNRFASVGTDAVTTALVCFGSCSECVVIPTVNVTFVVDMSEQIVSDLGVHIAGSFNNFSPFASEMTAIGNGQYSFTAEVPYNTAVQYKYINGNDWPQSEVVPFECGVNDGFGGFNRNIVTNETDITLPAICFSQCAECIAGLEEAIMSNINIYPNPTSDLINISGVETGREVTILGMDGRIVRQFTSNGKDIISVGDLAPGLYQIKITGLTSSLRFNKI